MRRASVAATGEVFHGAGDRVRHRLGHARTDHAAAAALRDAHRVGWLSGSDTAVLDGCRRLAEAGFPEGPKVEVACAELLARSGAYGPLRAFLRRVPANERAQAAPFLGFLQERVFAAHGGVVGRTLPNPHAPCPLDFADIAGDVRLTFAHVRATVPGGATHAAFHVVCRALAELGLLPCDRAAAVLWQIAREALFADPVFDSRSGCRVLELSAKCLVPWHGTLSAAERFLKRFEYGGWFRLDERSYTSLLAVCQRSARPADFGRVLDRMKSDLGLTQLPTVALRQHLSLLCKRLDFDVAWRYFSHNFLADGSRKLRPSAAAEGALFALGTRGDLACGELIRLCAAKAAREPTQAASKWEGVAEKLYRLVSATAPRDAGAEGLTTPWRALMRVYAATGNAPKAHALMHRIACGGMGKVFEHAPLHDYCAATGQSLHEALARLHDMRHGSDFMHRFEHVFAGVVLTVW